MLSPEPCCEPYSELHEQIAILHEQVATLEGHVRALEAERYA